MHRYTYFQTQVRFPIGGVSVEGPKLTHSLCKQQTELLTRT